MEQQFHYLVRRGFSSASLDEIIKGRRGTVHVTFDDGFRSVREAVPILERLSLHASVFICPRYAETGGAFTVGLSPDVVRNLDPLKTLTWDHLRDLADRGVAIGSHSMTHPHLTTLSDEELRTELVDSKEWIETELGQRCRIFSYPFGDEDARVRAAVQTAGYDAAFGAPGKELSRDRYSIPRVLVVSGDGKRRFALKTSPMGRRFVALSRRPRGRTRAH
jgi:peptidoglycan/xylan/chitin deacetylase (PgdA/CDA1 family)